MINPSSKTTDIVVCKLQKVYLIVSKNINLRKSREKKNQIYKKK